MSACAQPGCQGTIDDGYCDTCGMAPATVRASAAGPQPGPSARTSTAATGSARTGSNRVPTTRSGRSTRSTRSGSLRTGRTGSRSLGNRPLARPTLPALDPLSALVPGTVPDRKRFCGSCDAQLKRDSGFCPKCGQEYSFVPTLQPGDVVADKYEIKGTIAFGGLGWIYLALDTVLNRWVTLKGLLNAKDPKMLEVAVAEREFLAAVKHPNIVGIYDFVTHGSQGFIVMEYVNGKTLMTLRKEAGGPMPVAEACSYIAEILPALGYLDEMGMVYCDFKPENVMVEEDTVKLIDLGAVRRADDAGGDIYGSKGYTAPEAHQAPTPVSDLYSVARALAVLVASFDFQGTYESSLPPADQVEVFEKHEALYRFLLKATRTKADERFQTAAEMAEQLLGVLRTIAGPSADLGPVESSIFDPDSQGSLEAEPSSRPGSDGVPKLKVDREDAAAAIITAASAIGDPRRRRDLFERALKNHPTSLELRLRIVDELTSMGQYAEADRRLEQIQKDAPSDWRTAWYRGRRLLAEGKLAESLATFHGVVDDLPGELGPKQALARAYEASGDLDRAIHYFDAVSRTDPAFVSSAFGLARCHEKKRNRAAAAEALRRVSASSSRYLLAQTTLARLLISTQLGYPTVDDLTHASDAVEGLADLISGFDAHLLRADLLIAAATHPAAKPGRPQVIILGNPLEERALRLAAEAELRACAHVAESPDDRILLIDEANAVRPFTVV